jgi:hypothetical protein
MNWAHIHLLLTHISVIGIAIAIALFFAGRIRRSREIEWVSLQMFFALALLSLAVYLRGSPANRQIRDMPGDFPREDPPSFTSGRLYLWRYGGSR